MKKPVTIKQLQILLGVSRPTIDKWVEEGLITKYSIPGTRRVYLDLEECRQAFKPIHETATP